MNHGIFNVYHFWNFVIFKCTWVCSSSSSKNKNIFLNLSINSINLKESIYLSISKMCSSLFSRGNQACARIANAKRTTQSRDAALSAIYIEGRHLNFELARWPWQPVRFFENNSEIHDICWGIMNTYFLILWISYYRLDLDETDAKLDALFCPQRVQMTGICVFPHCCWGHF